MISPVIAPLVRRAILDLVADVGGELNDDTIQLCLNELGHRVARADVGAEMRWLAAMGLLVVEPVGSYLVARSTANGRDTAAGLMRVDGVGRHKTGD